MLTRSTLNGHLALFLENEFLRVGVLPHKGADVFEFTYRPAYNSQQVQFLMQTPWGLKPPGSEGPRDFLENYEGGWQELFPNANDGCHYHDQEIPFHGEVALLPWNFDITADNSEEAKLHLWVDCRKTPFRLERTMQLFRGESRLKIKEKVTNIGNDPYEFVWGHHITLGGDFLEDGCRLDVPANQFFTPDTFYEPLTARLEAGQTGTWPLARGRGNETIDLCLIPGPQSHSHDDVILGGLEHGFYRVTNSHKRLSFILEWDGEIFPWLMFWQPYGGADLPPLTGIYGVGLEPWVSRYPLAEAVKAGQARTLMGGQSLETELTAEVRPI